ncbi:phage tail tape measure protein [Cupriavidus gilardii]|uniref:Phage tail tape measure protein n=1 Tax=Cupriavidus gilardii TaxID=82541 RepID=A0ABY4W0J6_9BURK|nr:phage tail tape measure protein [Cupriavidus gilardii]USE81158.1 phage tail tape measure protein [Cupriavidus gilardii]
MSEVVGKATLQADADVSGIKAGFAEAKKSVQDFEQAAAKSGQNTSRSVRGMGDAAREASDRMDAAARRFLQSLERQADRAGKTAAEYAALRAQQLGVSDAAAPFVARLKAAEAATDSLGISARQTAAALRMVPAQFTDIVTQLAGGQSPLLILTQQGGQLKDMFGGIGPAARALGGYVAGLINPFTLSAGAAAALAFAFEKGSRESTAYQRALISSGNAAGATAAQLAGMAQRISETVGTQGAAAEALTQLAATGRIAGEQFESLASAALAWQKATGTAIDDTVRHYVSLGDEPVKASLKLNEQYNYLTFAVYEQIRALEEQGRKDEAAALAQQTFADAMSQRSDQIMRSLGLLERGWNSVAGAAKSAWDYMLGIGRPDTLADVRRNIAEVQAELAKMGDASGFGSTAGGAATGDGNRRRAGALARLRALQAQEQALQADAEKAKADADAKAAEREKIAAQQRLDAQEKATRSRAQQRKEEIDQLTRDAAKVGMAADEYNRRVALINEKYKDPKGSNVRAYTEDAGTRFLDQLRQQQAALQAQLLDTDKLTAAEKKRAEFEQMIADIKSKKVLTADQRSLLAREAEIRAQLELNVAADAEVEAKKAATKEQEKQNRLLEQARTQAVGIEARIRENAASRAEQYDRQLAVFGLGSQAREQLASTQSVYREFDRIRTDWIKTMSEKGMVGTDLYVETIDKIRDAQQAAVEQVGQYYSDLRTKQSDWRYGALAAMSDYRDYAANVADQTGRLFGGLFQGLEDSVVKFAMTGKLSFGDFAKSVIADLARIQARTAISGLAQMGINFVGSLFAGSFAGAGAFGGAASAASGMSAGSTSVLAGDYFGTAGSVTGNYATGIFGGFRAEGGPVEAGKAYVVGEKRPEVFVPAQSGRILPSVGGGDIYVSTQVNMQDGTSQTQVNGGDAALGKQVGDMVNAAVSDRLNREMRQGGLLWRMRMGQA